MECFLTTEARMAIPMNLIGHISHSAKGSTWEDHKYIKRINGTYYYPASYEGGRHLDSATSKSGSNSSGQSTGVSTAASTDSSQGNTEPVGALKTTDELSEEDIESLAREVIRGNFANGQDRKELLGEAYQKVQDRVNQILKGSSSSKKMTEVTQKEVEKGESLVQIGLKKAQELKARINDAKAVKDRVSASSKAIKSMTEQRKEKYVG